jgi:hypothetical protein
VNICGCAQLCETVKLNQVDRIDEEFVDEVQKVLLQLKLHKALHLNQVRYVFYLSLPQNS